MKQYANGIKKKNKLMQLFCKHKNIGSFTEQSTFQSLSGETVHHICTDCGKYKGKQFLEYEGMGFK
ncbi:50S ribosomal protein L32 [Gracilibacillus thailandensis]|uniref:Large ribosomal subunit protein bL32 n=1 Tax=Gracilibacillus thailandensis TaxID=563735 RepID=A0A6N7QW55_9BACI|nr:50S ribosomal protein L32 [Gracilibacillus thailandensis]MRI65125.1 50S ribosomal protein L32 [Gracilibacillus thailandensis]